MSLLGQENKKPQCVLMYTPCGDGGIKNGIQSHEVEIWTTLKISLHVCEAICGATNDSPTSCVGSHATSWHTTMWDAIVYRKNPHFEWHTQNCMFGKCEDHGVDNLALYLDEKDGTSHAKVCCKCFNMEKVVTKKGEEKILKLLHMKTNFTKFIQTLKPKLQLYMTQLCC